MTTKNTQTFYQLNRSTRAADNNISGCRINHNIKIAWRQPSSINNQCKSQLSDEIVSGNNNFFISNVANHQKRVAKNIQNENIGLFSGASDAKGYRILLHIFAGNVNKYFRKNHKDILGELEQLYKIPLSNEEKKMLESDFANIYERNSVKFMKQMLNRNNDINKSIKEYRINHPKTVQKNEIVTENLAQSTQTAPTKSQKQKKRPATSGHYPKRSSYSQRNQTKQYNKSVNITNMAYPGFINYDLKYSQSSHYKMEDQYRFVAQNLRKFSNSNKYNKSTRKQNQQEQNQEGDAQAQTQKNKKQDETENNRIFQSSSRHRNSFKKNDIEYNTNQQNIHIDDPFYLQTSINYQSCKNSSKFVDTRSLIKQSSQKTQRLKIQQKLMTLNTATSANVIQPQSRGYRAKSRCWATNLQKKQKISNFAYQKIKTSQRFKNSLSSYKSMNNPSEKQGFMIQSFNVK